MNSCAKLQKKSQMPRGKWDFYINLLYSAKIIRTSVVE